MEFTEPMDSSLQENPYKLLIEAASMIPKSHYTLGFLIFCVIYLYNFLEFHFLQDLRTGFRGSPVSLTYHSTSQLYHQVVSKCRLLHGRYIFLLYDVCVSTFLCLHYMRYRIGSLCSYSFY